MLGMCAGEGAGGGAHERDQQAARGDGEALVVMDLRVVLGGEGSMG